MTKAGVKCVIQQYTFFCKIESQRGMHTLIFLYIRRLGSFFGVQNLNFNIFLGYQKN